MAGDYTRFRYNPLKDTSGVQMQQGRVLLDQDWNEYVQLQDRRWRAETMDIIGRAVVPIDTPTAFELFIGGTSFTIGIGRMYVDGLLAENHGIDPADPSKRLYDPILGELIGTAPIPYEQQPYYPVFPPFPADGKPHMVYLDVWERELTYLEDPGLVDQAVAVDTGTRVQTVWQVKVLPDTPGVACSTPPGTVAAIAPSAGRLSTSAAGVPSSTDPCIVPPNGGYRGSGNRCYRIEVHNGGPMGTAQFKWSRDNASVASAVTGINATFDTLTVVLTRRDSVLRFQPDDWVEVTDDHRYFQGLPGEMRQVASVDDVNLTIKLKTALPAGEFDATKPDRHTRVIRWDQRGIVRDPLGNKIVDVDANGGLIPVPAAGTTIVLEDGIQVTFSIDGAMLVPNFKALDYWIFDARVIDASVEILTQAPPRGILHHYAWLGFVTLPGGPASSCRVFWPPDFGESCDCSVCVSADSHNSGTLTIQSAISQVEGKGGGKVCLGPGLYNIADTIKISAAAAIEISGHGLPSLVAGLGFSSQKPMFVIDTSVNITFEDVAFLGPAASNTQPAIPGVVISNSSFVTIKRCLFISAAAAAAAGGAVPPIVGAPVGPPAATLSPAIALTGLVWGAQIYDNFFNNVQIAIGPSPVNLATAPFLAFSSIHNNKMACTDAGMAFADLQNAASFLEVSFADNAVSGTVGFLFRGLGLGVSIERNSFVVSAPPPTIGPPLPSEAIACNASELRISNNRIGGDPQNPGQDGIVLAGTGVLGVQVAGNQISGLTGSGIVVKARTILMEAIFSQNQLGTLGGDGIFLEPISFALDLDISGNTIANVGLASIASAIPVLAGILLLSTSNINVKITENVIENVGPGAQMGARVGIWVTLCADVRIGGNRVVDVGPPTAVTFGTGIAVIAVVGRLDIIDNEVRRASIPPLNSDPSAWSALLIDLVFGDANIRGNLLESFGSSPTAFVIIVIRSCLFCDNQCFLDNTVLSPANLVVQLGLPARLGSGAMIVSSNFVQGPARSKIGGSGPVMSLNPAEPAKTITVLGNIASGGGITVGGAALATPWDTLNLTV
ncbi:MAG: right-handed parallel beta-helix repeat-containing protein [Acidobacteriia bacterium]|nr:right-handed parallel beta-helix repeat-containing protein [Terriglobia bacterium]